jgi:hypothetical protein
MSTFNSIFHFYMCFSFMSLVLLGGIGATLMYLRCIRFPWARWVVIAFLIILLPFTIKFDTHMKQLCNGEVKTISALREQNNVLKNTIINLKTQSNELTKQLNFSRKSSKQAIKK